MRPFILRARFPIDLRVPHCCRGESQCESFCMYRGSWQKMLKWHLYYFFELFALNCVTEVLLIIRVFSLRENTLFYRKRHNRLPRQIVHAFIKGVICGLSGSSIDNIVNPYSIKRLINDEVFVAEPMHLMTSMFVLIVTRFICNCYQLHRA